MYAPSELDVSLLTYEAWLEFWFGQPLLERGESFAGKYFPDVGPHPVSRPECVVEHLKKLCTEFQQIGERYSLPQLNQGIWAMFGAEIELQKYLWDGRVPIERRIRCLASVSVPFSSYVAGHPVKEMENCFYMWWDLVLDSFWIHHGFSPDYTKLDSEGKDLLDAIFITLKSILESKDERCQYYALHGLGHLHHPSVRAVVQQYIESNRRQLDASAIDWLEECRDGTVM
ncbi:MAG TPA: hypothetical protein VHH73_06890 [Verrucomicrobiae bacterium]|nr:hypothetical protein [Verrucomicrobiae bacterium]